MRPGAYVGISLPSEALAIKDMHPSAYRRYLPLWGEDTEEVGISAKVLELGFKINGRKHTTQCMQIRGRCCSVT
jgi:hypothetical protein